ncbi:hypothetical protein [Caulobacter sp. NIBR1757]|uniref:hypothetical protein n=1 Tax=Caulobacter sp. NIBR1757 TaxID=3016000 RepID=UPI0022F004B7|nr:hypothetical protein [Caulobacter sp. NIBR1757]WGM40865.1 hypothetical protein AMEJIAPC_03812 [Caulobacter sp. NIBR1757]
MTMLIFAAILGALLGMTVRPPLLAVAISLAVSGGLHATIAWVGRLAETNPAQRVLAMRIDAMIGNDLHAIWPVLAAAGVGSIASAVMWSLANKQPTDGYWFRPDRRVVLMDQVEENDRHSAAEQRFRDILGR